MYIHFVSMFGQLESNSAGQMLMVHYSNRRKKLISSPHWNNSTLVCCFWFQWSGWAVVHTYVRGLSVLKTLEHRARTEAEELRDMDFIEPVEIRPGSTTWRSTGQLLSSHSVQCELASPTKRYPRLGSSYLELYMVRTSLWSLKIEPPCWILSRYVCIAWRVMR